LRRTLSGAATIADRGGVALKDRADWPAGDLAFEARGFEQLARGRAVVGTRQHLLCAERAEVDGRS